MEYEIRPVKMGGRVQSIQNSIVKINLFGRLGIISVQKDLIAEKELHEGDKLDFYFSYLEIKDYPLDYDIQELKAQVEQFPCLMGGKCREVNDTAVLCEIDGSLGTIAVPRRWVFTDKVLEEGQNVEFYLSKMQKRKEAS
ncbi:CBO2463/CBO2479 domain-containing protein [Oribacterium sp.]